MHPLVPCTEFSLQINHTFLKGGDTIPWSYTVFVDFFYFNFLSLQIKIPDDNCVESVLDTLYLILLSFLIFLFSCDLLAGVSKNLIQGPDGQISATVNIWVGPGYMVPHMLLTICEYRNFLHSHSFSFIFVSTGFQANVSWRLYYWYRVWNYAN